MRTKGSKNKPKEKLAGEITFTDKEAIDQEELKKKVAEQDALDALQ
jgi:hypothetical protein